jgi:predicted secreted Zn-dependent protease
MILSPGTSFPPAEQEQTLEYTYPAVASDVVEAIESESIQIFFYGIVYYEDVFGKPHKTRFCQKYDLGGGMSTFGILELKYNERT